MSATAAHMRWVEIDHAAIAHNVQTIRRSLNGAQLWPVVKGHAYGHDAVKVGQTCIAAGASGLAVSALPEALELRQGGIEAPLFVMNPVLPEHAPLYVAKDIVAAVEDEAGGLALAEANRSSKPRPVHVKVDTGLGRFGVREDAVAIVERLMNVPGLEVQGVFSHFAAADEADRASVNRQWAVFQRVLAQLEKAGVRPPVAHVANSAATLSFPETHLEMVRVGLSVYGMYPSAYVKERAEARGIELKPALTLRAKIASVRTLAANSGIGYGSTYVTNGPLKVATVPIGYSDGVSRNLSGKLEVLVNGERRAALGRVCMNHIIVDVDNLEVQPGDTITLIGRDGNERIAAEQWAAQLGTIAYEVVCMVGGRNPRVHRYDGVA